MEPWQAWLLLGILGMAYGKARLLARDAARASEACSDWSRGRECDYYVGLAIIDILFTFLLFILSLVVI